MMNYNLAMMTYQSVNFNCHRRRRQEIKNQLSISYQQLFLLYLHQNKKTFLRLESNSKKTTYTINYIPRHLWPSQFTIPDRLPRTSNASTAFINQLWPTTILLILTTLLYQAFSTGTKEIWDSERNAELYASGSHSLFGSQAVERERQGARRTFDDMITFNECQ